ncbi:gefF [Symbiodinium sp. CCMP2456]|nr:gefF [Symbiodinium sp. CCMP2456]
MRRYFAFGANLSPAALTLRLGAPGPEPSRPAALQDWELRFDVRGYWPQIEGAFASAAPCKGARIYGVVHMLSEAIAMTWSQVTFSGSEPYMRWGHKAVLTTSGACFFGGYGDGYGYDGGLFPIDSWCFDLSTRSWDEKMTYGYGPMADGPAGRRQHSAATSGESMWIFGGEGDDGQMSDELWELNPQEPSWTLPTVSAAKPPGRRGHTAVMTSGTLYVFGGYNSGNLNDLWSINVLAGNPEWVQMSSVSTSPSARADHSAVLMSTVMWIFGGSAGDGAMNDVWFVELTQDPVSWMEVSTSGTSVRRTGHSAHLHSGKMWVFGGHDGTGLSSALTYLDLDQSGSYRWEESAPLSGTRPPARWFHAAVLDQGELWVFGGDAHLETDFYLDVWYIDLEEATTTLTSTTIVSTTISSSSSSSAGTYNQLIERQSYQRHDEYQQDGNQNPHHCNEQLHFIGQYVFYDQHREANQAVERVDTVEAAEVVQFAATLSFNSSQGVLGEVSADLATGRLRMVAFSPDALDGNVIVTATASSGSESSEVAVARLEVSPQVLAAVATENGLFGPVLLSITTVADQIARKFQDRRVEGEIMSVLGSGVVSLNFRALDGSTLKADNLTSPLRIVIQTDEKTASCAFWSEDESRWSSDGITTLPDMVPGQITCLTTHLSLFGAVGQVSWDNAFLVLKCSTAWEHFSAQGFQEALRQVSGAHWQSTLPAISVFTFLALFCAVFARASYVDCKKLVPWEEIEPVLFKQTQAAQDSHAEVPTVWAWRRVAEATQWTCWCAGMCTGISGIVALILECKAPEASVNRCIRSLHAHRSGVARDSLAIVVKPDERFELEEELVSKQVSRSARSSRLSSLVHALALGNMNGFNLALRDLSARWNVHIHGATAVQSILNSRWFVRVCLLVPAFHPWLAVLRLSLLTSYKVRVSLIFLKLCAAGATNAMFFSSTSPAPNSDPACLPPQNMLAWLVQNTVVGMISAILGDCAIFALFWLQNRKPVEKDWTTAAKARQLNIWSCRAGLFWFLWLVYSTSCLLYIMMFLATSRLADAHGWYLATGMSLLQDLVALPLFVALVLGTMASLALLSSGVRARTAARWLKGEAEQTELEEALSRPDSECSSARMEIEGSHCHGRNLIEHAWMGILPGTLLDAGELSSGNFVARLRYLLQDAQAFAAEIHVVLPKDAETREGVQEGQNQRVEGGRVTDLDGQEISGEGCSFYTCGPSMRLAEGSEARPSARYLEMLETAALEAGLPGTWAESFRDRRCQLPRGPSLRREALLAGLPPGAPAISFASSIAGDQALTSLCGLVFACKDAPEAVFPALSMQEMALAVLRRGVRPWRGEKMPDTLEEAGVPARFYAHIHTSTHDM